MTSVLVTGGSGSFGTAYVERMLEDKSITRLAIYSRGEHLQEEMASRFSDERLRFFIGDVRDSARLEMALKGVDTIIHAAALKIVPTAEYNPTECIATNVHGAENVVKAALRAGVKRVVALSTDKAVNPINLYGASKLAAEKIFVAANALAAGECNFSVVRYGNVAGSRGSVIPLFKLLAAKNVPLTITDPKMTRFWITMDQAIDLVIHAISVDFKGIIVPKIPSIRIVDLARAIAPEGLYKTVGIRPGEKLHECLLTEDEARYATKGNRYYYIHPVPQIDSLPDGFRFTSDLNDEWLSIEDIGRVL